LCPTVGPPTLEWDTFVRLLIGAHLGHRPFGQNFLARGLRVARDLFRGFVTSHRANFQLRCPKLGEARGGGFPKTVRNSFLNWPRHTIAETRCRNPSS
jgi:hypothetical protein